MRSRRPKTKVQNELMEIPKWYYETPEWFHETENRFMENPETDLWKPTIYLGEIQNRLMGNPW